MVPASLLAANGKVSPLWLVFSYLLQVLGEMCLSPVGLSTVTKLAPARFASSTMGMWMLATACGNFLAGYLAGFFDENSTTTLITMFGYMGGFLFLAAAYTVGIDADCSQIDGRHQISCTEYGAKQKYRPDCSATVFKLLPDCPLR